MKEQARYPQETIDKVRELAVVKMLSDAKIADKMSVTRLVVQNIRTRNLIPSGDKLRTDHGNKITIEAWNKNHSIEEAATAYGATIPAMRSRLRNMVLKGLITDHENLAVMTMGGNRKKTGRKPAPKKETKKAAKIDMIDKSRSFLASLHTKRMANVNAWAQYDQ